VRRALAIYLCVYYLLVVGAALTVWQSGLINHLPQGLTYAAFAIAVALGALLWVTSRKPPDASP
jgi:hypothetical protein